MESFKKYIEKQNLNEFIEADFAFINSLVTSGILSRGLDIIRLMGSDKKFKKIMSILQNSIPNIGVFSIQKALDLIKKALTTKDFKYILGLQESYSTEEELLESAMAVDIMIILMSSLGLFTLGAGQFKGWWKHFSKDRKASKIVKDLLKDPEIQSIAQSNTSFKREDKIAQRVKERLGITDEMFLRQVGREASFAFQGKNIRKVIKR